MFNYRLRALLFDEQRGPSPAVTCQVGSELSCRASKFYRGDTTTLRVAQRVYFCWIFLHVK